MPFIQNAALVDIPDAWHRDIAGNGVLIQIVDPDWETFPVPLVEFTEIHQFRFLDVEEGYPEGIVDEQAEQIAAILKDSLSKGRNVIVHCHAGLCRSGAVVEAGVRLGFEDTKRHRSPNRLVLTKLGKYLPEIVFRPFEDEGTSPSQFT